MRAVSLTCWCVLFVFAGSHCIHAESLHDTMFSLQSMFAMRTAVVLSDVPPPIASPEVRNLVAQILDERLPTAKRQELIQRNPKLAADLISGMTNELTTGSQEEFRRIPWLWRIAIGAGKGNDPEIIRAVLDVALPEPKQVLHDWRATVVGGGIINGISQLGLWPAGRLQEILLDQKALQLRWEMAIDEAILVANDEKEVVGIRYDAMRMLGMGVWDRHGRQLERYLQPGVHPELQMGAISGLADMDHAGAVAALIKGMGYYSEKNRQLAVDGLLRGEVRQKTLIEALEQGTVQPAWVTSEQREKLFKIADATWQQRAERVFKKP